MPRLLESAVEFYERLSQSEEGSEPEVQAERARTFGRLGDLSSAIGRQEQAETAYQSALDIQKKLAANHPTVTEYQNSLASSHHNLGNLYIGTGRTADAETAFQSALDIRRKLAADHPTVTEFQSDLAANHTNLGNLYYATGRPAEAVTAYQDARGIWQNLFADDPTVAEYQSGLSDSYYGLACAYSLSSVAASQDTKLPPAAQNKSAEQYAVRALECLMRAEAASFFKHPANLAHLKANPGFDAIREREDFKRLLADLEKKSPSHDPESK